MNEHLEMIYQWYRGRSIWQIRRSLHLSRKTIGKYLNRLFDGGFRRDQPLPPEEELGRLLASVQGASVFARPAQEKLGRYQPQIEKWLEEEEMTIQQVQRHSRFQVYRGQSVEPHDAPAWERLCAYIARVVFASTRVEYHPSTGAVTYRTAQGADLGLDALVGMAWVTPHLPHRGEHTRHYFGYDSNVTRGQRKKLAARAAAQPGQPTGDSTDTAEAARPPAACNPADADPDRDDFRRECRRTWARFIQPLYEVNPLSCPDCGGKFEVIAFIHAPQTLRKILEHLHLWDLSPRPPPASLLGRKMNDLLPALSPHHEPKLDTGFPSDSVFRDDVPTYTDGSPGTGGRSGGRKAPHLKCPLFPVPLRPAVALVCASRPSFRRTSTFSPLQTPIPPCTACQPGSKPPLTTSRPPCYVSPRKTKCLSYLCPLARRQAPFGSQACPPRHHHQNPCDFQLAGRA